MLWGAVKNSEAVYPREAAERPDSCFQSLDELSEGKGSELPEGWTETNGKNLEGVWFQGYL